MPDIPEPTFDDLPSFDARKFEPPSWAKNEFHKWGESSKNGESSKSSSGPKATSKEEYNEELQRNGNDLEDEEEEDGDEDDIWEDAKEDIVEPDEATFSNDELKELLDRATKFKTGGNQLFTSKPPKYDDAIISYLKAIDHLPTLPNQISEDAENPKIKEEEKVVSTSGIEEVTDEEALKIQEEQSNNNVNDDIDEEEVQRKEIEFEIRELTKAVWGNLAACYIAIKDDKKAVEACTEALKIDPKYVKGLHRRAAANERIGELTALASAKDDYTLLQKLLPPTSPLQPSIRKSLFSLPERIKDQEKQQMDEMMGKLKDLGNSLLGNFGLSTDNFKFEKQDNGGWGMQFQR